MLESVFDAMYDQVKTENSIKLPVRTFLRSIGVRSIQPMKDTDTLGKYLLIIQAEKEENICNKVHQICENLKVDQPLYAQDFYATFGYYSFLNDKIRTKNNTHNLAQRYLKIR